MNIAKEIQEITKEIKNANIKRATELFTPFIDETITQLGGKSSKDWDEQFRKKIYTFGVLFQTADAHPFLAILDKKLEVKTENSEVLEFIKSEISINIFSYSSEYVIDCLKDLIKEYPTNAEFHHSLGHHYVNISDPIKALTQYKIAHNFEPKNSRFLNTRFNAEKSYFCTLLGENKFDKARSQVDKMGNCKYLTADPLFNNIIVSLFDRLDDHKLIEKKISEIDEIVRKKTEKDRIKLIEVLGFFVAFVTFIMTSIKVALSNLEFGEVITLTFSLALIFLVFNISLSLVFQQLKGSIFKEGKFWLLIVLLLSLLGIIFLKK